MASHRIGEERLYRWAQSQIDGTAKPAVWPEIGVSVLQLLDELERLQDETAGKRDAPEASQPKQTP
ncbi:hypothetical protein [Gloeobacter morelensis]|uniref:Uncharacterized protein n=1 Tax=Gloeobacter morelensis MG652769 TaxID=2781736 RepID=A0ABY3PTE1_9CYAN|nr:hypothetical protein [Gloeobacter morelensis]UFP96772.1 hypothetical protein ISF26_11415 [Gloeobacter morelensis MG652769]